EVRQFQQQARQSLQANLRLTLTNVNSALVISTLMVVGTAVMYYIGTVHVLSGTLTLGSLLVFSAYLLMLYQPLESLTYTTWAMEGATAGAKRCFEVLDRQDDVVDSPGAVAISSAQGAIAFEAVNFGYRSEEHTSELQSLAYLVCRLLLEKKKIKSASPLVSITPCFHSLSSCQRSAGVPSAANRRATPNHRTLVIAAFSGYVETS